jgi:hypothetical protein
MKKMIEQNEANLVHVLTDREENAFSTIRKMDALYTRLETLDERLALLDDNLEATELRLKNLIYHSMEQNAELKNLTKVNKTMFKKLNTLIEFMKIIHDIPHKK